MLQRLNFHKGRSRLSRVAAALLAGLCAVGIAPHAGAAEPNVKIASTWWPQPVNVWTPVGWKDHLFRFQVVYNGDLLCTPAGKLDKPQIRKYLGRGFQLNFDASADGSLPPLPNEDVKLKLTDGGIGVQGVREDHDAPVIWTDFPRPEGIVLREEVFAHMKGGSDVKSGIEPLYAWVRLSVRHVDPIRAPKHFSFGVQLSGLYFDESGSADDTLYLLVKPKEAKLKEALSSRTIAGEKDQPAGMLIEQGDQARLRVQPGGDGKISFAEVAPGSGRYNLKIELPAREGAHTDLLVPMLTEPAEELASEAALGFDGALKQSDKYWGAKPATAARVHTPEHYINQAIRRNIQLAQIIAERNPDNGEYSFLSGSYGYDALWSTPTSMVSHMFLDLLGYHDVVARHLELYRKNQGTVHPPGKGFDDYSGYFSTPKTLTAINWLTDHGAIMEAISRHALLTGDQKFITEWTQPLIKACDFIKKSCQAKETGGVEGILPPAVATDSGVPSQAVWNEAWNYKGLSTTVELLKRIHNGRADEFADLASQFKENFNKAYRAAVARGQTWTDPQGKKREVPLANLVPPPHRHIYDDAFLLDGGPLVLPWSGLMLASDPMMKDFADFFREGPNWQLRRAQPSAIDRAVLIHEISSCEPCYSWNIVNSWQTGDRAHFLEGMYSLFCGAISPQTYVNCEHRNAMYGNVFAAPLATWCLRQSVIDDQIEPGTLHLLRLVPLAWLSKTEQTIFDNMPSEFGPVDLRFGLSADGKTLNISFTGHWRIKPAKVILHLPPSPGLEQVSINGRSIRQSGATEIAIQP
jgi:hypothetical protein